VAVLNDGEIFAKVHKFKLFRKEGNLLIDVYEALIGEPAHKFIAVPNLVFEESAKGYFGFGDTKGEALKDCLKKIKDVSVHDIFSSDTGTGRDERTKLPSEPKQTPELSSSSWRLPKIFSRDR
jgi:hypothetical protein